MGKEPRSANVWHDDPPSLEQTRTITKVRHDDLPSAKVWHDDPPSLEQRRAITKVRQLNLHYSICKLGQSQDMQAEEKERHMTKEQNKRRRRYPTSSRGKR